eukprot:TRINITY_DN3820_c0_g1_i2.p3 TRINITY_DN3820_c0_g1~~TRINITY_DN3820_c0_g1_i2.p3  ORF type:complete len:107 (+),score=11.94 TRINITY_DN3820_c0_g1_i2:22-321(+)
MGRVLKRFKKEEKELSFVRFEELRKELGRHRFRPFLRFEFSRSRNRTFFALGFYLNHPDYFDQSIDRIDDVDLRGSFEAKRSDVYSKQGVDCVGSELIF